ncbi:MAG TPA: cytochrome c oxidase subunit II [Flavipsychrobacter sp.]|nr:cytochrome c oxidase subunit II [Flavipsychrobacter sp.]
MSGFITIVIISLVFIIIYQIAKASEYATILRGEDKVRKQVNRLMAWLLVAFFIIGVWGIWECHLYMADKMLPVSASEHGEQYDLMFRVTIYVTGIVFFITQALLFWFAFKYQSTEKRTPYYLAHNNKLELIWTTIPAIAMASLVAVGLRNWSKMTSEAPKNAQVVEIVGKQFNWVIRYPGADGVLGKRDFRKINDANNVLGLDWNDKANADDVIAENGEMHIVKGRPVKLVIGSRDVIHDVGLPHFRMKMDAVPGIVTTIWFTPLYTSEEMKKITGNPNFVYEISCDQMCGKGHYSMRGTVIVETEAEHKAWMEKQQSYYAIQNPAKAPAADSTVIPTADTTTKAITMNTPSK